MSSKLFPASAASLSTLGSRLRREGRLSEAIEAHRQATALDPSSWEIQVNLGNALKAAGRFEDALLAFDAAIALGGKGRAVLHGRGTALQQLGCFGAAADTYETQLGADPNDSVMHYLVGVCYKELGRFADSLTSFERSLTLNPSDPEVAGQRGLILLTLGRFPEGFQQFEVRWQSQHFGPARGGRGFAQPLWLGQSNVAGQRILLHAEQGLGDTLQFCRYAPRVADLGAEVLLEVPASLVKLVHSLSAKVRVLEAGKPLPDFDCHTPLMSLPLAFMNLGWSPGDFPAELPYLSVEAVSLRDWGTRLADSVAGSGPSSGLPRRIGLVWRGSRTHLGDADRSLSLDQLLKALLPAVPEHVQFVSLQRELADEDRPALAACPRIQHFGADLHDFSDTAALCTLVDEVISVDTSVAHLAGALARPLRLLLPFVPDWRWQLDRPDSPWYPTARLYRQPSRGDWGSVLAAVAGDL